MDKTFTFKYSILARDLYINNAVVSKLQKIQVHTFGAISQLTIQSKLGIKNLWRSISKNKYTILHELVNNLRGRQDQSTSVSASCNVP